MVKKVFVVIFFCLYFFVLPFSKAERISLPSSLDKRILTELSRSQALSEFGPPYSINANLWYYNYPDNFYVYFSPESLTDKISIYPHKYEVNSGSLFQIKAFLLYGNSNIKDVSSYVDWSIGDTAILERKDNFFLPLGEGKTEVFALYKGIVSNICNVYIEDTAAKEDKQKVKLLAVDIFPYNPLIYERGQVNFLAFGIFLNADSKRVFVRDISSEVEWYISQGAKVSKSYNGNIYFNRRGTSEVFCEYQDLKSTTQEVSVHKKTSEIGGKIKAIHLIPSFGVYSRGYAVEMRGVATYSNNRTEDVTLQMRLEATQNVAAKGGGRLELKEEGIAEIEGHLGNIKSFPAKILVRRETLSNGIKDIPRVKEPHTDKDLLQAMSNTIKKMSLVDAVIEVLEIEPRVIRVPLGEGADFKAKVFYFNGSQMDVTSFVDWQSSDFQKAIVERGKLAAFSEGEVTIWAYLEGVKSNLANLIIEGPELKSIALSYPQDRLYVGDIFSIKATGYFTDEATEDITKLARWHIKGQKTVRELDEGNFKAVRRGDAEIYCQYKGVKSLPLKISVFISALTALVRVLFGFTLIIVTVFLVLYFTIKTKVKKLNELSIHNPSGFIVDLYTNIKAVLNVFGLRYRETIPPLEYARMINEKFSVKEDIFLKLSYKFSEANYSKHVITSDDALRFLNDYNKGMLIIKARASRYPVRFLLLLFRRHPFLIGDGSGAPNLLPPNKL